MSEMVLVEWFVQYGLERLVDGDWPLALAVLVAAVFMSLRQTSRSALRKGRQDDQGRPPMCPDSSRPEEEEEEA